MNVNRQQLHDLIDAVDISEFDMLCRLIAKFIPEDAATPDETEAIAAGREAVERGEYVLHEEIKWN
ncbi:MAG: hypothetical protein LBS24_07410 [Clostridiales Family XIII bacterium]|jgi:predicted transcriptional regulator|nr:hypothetical protein [Clostridiales Family XIII bacterium]